MPVDHLLLPLSLPCLYNEAYFYYLKASTIMDGRVTVIQVLTLYSLLIFPNLAFAQLRQNYYANICPDVETIVRKAITKRFHRLEGTIPQTLYMFFRDCFIQGCDASILIASSGSNRAEMDHKDMGEYYPMDGEIVTEVKAAVDVVASCRNKVSCADILAMGARDSIVLAGGPWYPVELGRLDGLSSTVASVDGKLPKKNMNLDQLNAIFAANGFTQTEMITLSGAHTVGLARCEEFMDRLYNFSKQNPMDPTLNKTHAAYLKKACSSATGELPVSMGLDTTTPRKFDNMYYKNLMQGKALFTSDQVLFTDSRSKQTVISLASDPQAFNKAFTRAITKLGRLGIKTGQNGNIRRNCSAFN